MRPLAVGVDIVDIPQVERMLSRFGPRVMERLLTDDERAYCLSKASPAGHIAARVAAKEATYKALSTGGGRQIMGWRDVEVVRGDHGEPSLALHSRARLRAAELGVARSLVSLSHSQTQAVAVVILAC